MFILEIALLIAILLVLVGLLSAVKSGFNETIKGLEAIAASLDK
jgi:hypothetical protein